MAESNPEPVSSPTPPANPPKPDAAEPASPEAPASSGSPAPSARSNRLSHGLRDMVISMAVLVVAVLGLAALTHSFTFSPGAPSTNGSGGPTINESEQYQLAVGQVHFPLRQPKLPASWHPNSADLDQVATAGTVGDQPNDMRIGWITASGAYLALAESNADAQDLARQEAGLPSGTPMLVKGQVQVGTERWTIYSGTRSEQSWVLDLGNVRLLITGNATPAEFMTMAKAVQAAPVIPAAGT